uniref:Uncharacterized protein n=1 Tax=Anguilla anguilla TaxID=7936 RepID=A0A0E9X8F1_ANGAN
MWCTDRPNIISLKLFSLFFFFKDQTSVTKKPHANKLTKKVFCTRSHCDSSHVLENVAIPCAPVLSCLVPAGVHNLTCLKIYPNKVFFLNVYFYTS